MQGGACASYLLADGDKAACVVLWVHVGAHSKGHVVGHPFPLAGSSVCIGPDSKHTVWVLRPGPCTSTFCLCDSRRAPLLL